MGIRGKKRDNGDSKGACRLAGLAKKAVSGTFRFLREGWLWILAPTIVVLTIIILIAIFADPYTEGTLPGKFIFLYALFGR